MGASASSSKVTISYAAASAVSARNSLLFSAWPDLCASYDAMSGCPKHDRSPIASRILCLANRHRRAARRYSAPGTRPSRIRFSKLPPMGSPAARNGSTFLNKPQGRARPRL